MAAPGGTVVRAGRALGRFAENRRAIPVLFGVALAVYAAVSIALPLRAGRDLPRYLLVYGQLFDAHVVFPNALLARTPGTPVVTGLLLEGGPVVSEAGLAVLYALSVVAWFCVASLETLSCDAGWRPWLFVKATTEDGLVGWSEVTDSHGSPTGLAGVVSDLAPLVVGRDPRAFEAIHWDLYRRTRQSPGSIVQKAIGGIENALLDLKGKALGVSVCRALRRADARDDPALLVALRDDAGAGVGGDRHVEARLVRRGHCARPRGRRERVSGLQDEHRRARRRAARPDARLRARRGHRPEPDTGAARRAHAAARSVPRGDGGQGAADRRPQLQPDDGGDRPRRARARAVRPRLARGRLVRRGRARTCEAPVADAALLRREPLHAPRLPARTSRPARWTSRPST